jgi:hypothetical protein
VVTWGNSFSGGDTGYYQLSTEQWISVTAELDGQDDSRDVTAIYSNDSAFAALRADGSVVTWGSSWSGGDSSEVSSQLNGECDVKVIYSNKEAFAALRADGSVVTWGNKNYGGDSNPVADHLDGDCDVKVIYSNNRAFAALRVDGSVVTWGDSWYGGDMGYYQFSTEQWISVTAELDGQDDSRDVTTIYSNYGAFAALRADGSVVTWGNSWVGGDMSYYQSSTNQMISVASELDGQDDNRDVTAIYSNNGAFAALRADGSVVTWGDSWYGGDSSAVASQLDGHDDSRDVTVIYSNYGAFAALRADGSVVTWGDSEGGGDSSAVASQLNGQCDVTAIYSNSYAFAALRADGSVVTWGDSLYGGDSSAVASQLDGYEDSRDVTAIYSNYGAFAALRADGSVVTWGDSGSGGDSSLAPKSPIFINTSIKNIDGSYNDDKKLHYTLCVQDTAENINAAWERLKTLVNEGYLGKLVVDDHQPLNISGLFLPFGSHGMDVSSLGLLKRLQTTGELNIHVNGYQEDRLPSSSQWTQLKAALPTSTPVHFIADSYSAVISVDDLIQLQTFAAQGVVEDILFNNKTLTLIGLPELGKIDKDIFKSVPQKTKTQLILDDDLSKVNATTVHGIVTSPFYTLLKERYFFADNNKKIGILDHSENINQYLDDLINFYALFSTMKISFTNDWSISSPHLSLDASQLLLGDAINVLNAISSSDPYILTIRYSAQDVSDEKVLNLSQLNHVIVDLTPKDWQAFDKLATLMAQNQNSTLHLNLTNLTMNQLVSNDEDEAGRHLSFIDADGSSHAIVVDKAIHFDLPILKRDLFVSSSAKTITSAEVLAYAMSSQISAIHVMDTKENIEKNMLALIQAYKTGKLAQIDVLNHEQVVLPLFVGDKALDKNIALLFNQDPSNPNPLIYTLHASDVKKTTALTFSVEDKAQEIETYWSDIEQKQSSLHTIYVSDQQPIQIEDLFLGAENYYDFYENSYHFSDFNLASQALMSKLHGASDFNLICQFYYNEKTGIVVNQLPSKSTYDRLKKLSIGDDVSGNIHLVMVNDDVSNPNSDAIVTNLSTRDLSLFANELTTNKKLIDVTIDVDQSTQPYVIEWNQHDLRYAWQVSTQAIPHIKQSDPSKPIQIDYLFSDTFKAIDVFHLLHSDFYTQFLKHTIIYDYAQQAAISGIEDTADQIERHLADLTHLIEDATKENGLGLFGVRWDYVNNSKSLVNPSITLVGESKTIHVNAKDIALNSTALKAISGSYLLIVEDSSSALNNAPFSALDLAAHPNIRIELKPQDLDHPIVLDAANSENIISINAAHLTQPNGSFSESINSVNGTAYFEVKNGSKTMMSLAGKQSTDSVKFYAPLDSESSILAKYKGQVTSLSEYFTLQDAMISAKTAQMPLKIKDTAENIRLHFEELVTLQKSGKLLEVSVVDPAIGQSYTTPIGVVATTATYLRAKETIDLIHWNATTRDIAIKFSKTEVNSIVLTDTTNNIEKNIDILASDNSKIQRIELTDSNEKKTLTITAAQYVNDVDVISKITTPHQLVVNAGSTTSSAMSSLNVYSQSASYYSALSEKDTNGRNIPYLRTLDLSADSVMINYGMNGAENEVIKLVNFGVDDKLNMKNKSSLSDISIDNQFGVLIQDDIQKQYGVFIVGVSSVDLHIQNNTITL